MNIDYKGGVLNLFIYIYTEFLKHVLCIWKCLDNQPGKSRPSCYFEVAHFGVYTVSLGESWCFSFDVGAVLVLYGEFIELL